MSTTLDRRSLLKGFAAVAGTAILAACGGNDTTATTASTSGTTASGASTTAAGAATTAATRPATSGSATAGATSASTGATTGSATTGSAATTAATSATTGSASAGATRPATSGSATAGATSASTGATTGSATTGTVTGSAPAMVAAGGMPMGPTMAMCATGSIVALGSTALQPVVDAAAKVFSMKCMGAQINVQGGGSGTGLTQVFGGQATIGDSDLFAEDASGIDAKMLEDHQVCIEPFAMAANPNVKVDSLTQDQVIGIWTGKITNYKDVGGPDQPIVIINRPASSGTRGTFKQFALKGMNEAQGKALTEDSSGAVAQAIKDTPGAIGYLALAYFKQDNALKTINFNGKAPTIDNISNDSYPIWAYGHMYTKGPAMGLAKAFIDYILSPDVQNTIIPSLGYFSVSQVTAKHMPASAKM